MKELNALQEQLEESKKRLKDVDESIKILTGKDQSNLNKSESSNGLEKRRRRSTDRDSSRSRQKRKRSTDRRRQSNSNGSETDSENDDEDDDEPISKHTIQSSVVSKQKIIKSKEDLIKIQNKDTNSNQRNKRIFGMILNTLQKFKNEDQARSESSQARQRKEVEKKIEVKEQEEKIKIKEEKNELIRERRRQEDRIKIIEKKLQLTEGYQEWEKRQLCLKNFIRTKTKPFIYYKPRIIDETNENLIKETGDKIDEEIKKRKIEIEQEIEKLEIKENELNSIQLNEKINTETSKQNLNDTTINRDGEDDDEEALKNEPETTICDDGEDEDEGIIENNKQSNEDPQNDNNEDVQKNIDDEDELDDAVMVSEPGLLAE